MLGKSMTIKGIFTAIILLTIGFTGVSLDIKNVDLTAGTLDIYMTNVSGCSYCSDSTYNNNTQNWVDKKNYCELASAGDTTWIAYASMTQQDCSGVPSLTDNGGWWFDGIVGGFQFELSGITITEATVPDGFEASYDVTTNPANEGAALFFSFSTTGATIPVGMDVLLTHITFTDFNNSDICFGDDTDSAGYTLIVHEGAGYLAVDWGGCYCGSASQNDADGDSICNDEDTCQYDEYNDADGDGVCGDDDDCADTAAGAAVDDNGCSESQILSISQVGNSLPAEFSITQNFPNPFNPVTSITFDVAEMDEVSLVVYDLTGKEVATLVSGTYTPGTYKVEWNAVNNAGDGIVSGMYIYRYISSEKAITRKMLYLK